MLTIEQGQIIQAITDFSQDGYRNATVEELYLDLQNKSPKLLEHIAVLPPQLYEPFSVALLQLLKPEEKVDPLLVEKRQIVALLEQETTLEGIERLEIANYLLENRVKKTSSYSRLQTTLTRVKKLSNLRGAAVDQTLRAIAKDTTIPRHLMCCVMLSVKRDTTDKYYSSSVIKMLDSISEFTIDGLAFLDNLKRLERYTNDYNHPELATFDHLFSIVAERGASLVVQKYLNLDRAATLLNKTVEEVPAEIKTRLATMQPSGSTYLREYRPTTPRLLNLPQTR